MRRKIEAAQQKAAAEEAAGPLSATQIARLQLQASEAMQAGESVAAALKRLGGHSRRPTKHSRRGGDDGAGSEGSVQQQQQVGAAASELGGLLLSGTGHRLLLLQAGISLCIIMDPQLALEQQRLRLPTPPPTSRCRMRRRQRQPRRSSSG